MSQQQSLSNQYSNSQSYQPSTIHFITEHLQLVAFIYLLSIKVYEMQEHLEYYDRKCQLLQKITHKVLSPSIQTIFKRFENKFM